MNGFTAVLRNWFSDENLDRLEKRVKTWWTSKDSGWKDLILAAPKLILKVLALILLAVIATVIFVRMVRDSPQVLFIAFWPIVLLLWRKFKLAGGYLLLVGAIPIAGCILSFFVGTDHTDGLYGALILISVVATYRIDKKATVIIGTFAGLAFVADLVFQLLGGVVDLLAGGFPTNVIVHVTWIVLAVIAIGAAWLFTKRSAATILTAAFLAVGYSQFVWGYAGLRWQEWTPSGDPFGSTVYPDEFFYGVMLLTVGVAVLTATPLARHSDTSVEEFSDEAYAWLDALYERDKQVRVLKAREHAFLVKELQRLNTTEAALEEIGVTPEAFEAYATERGIAEIRELGIVRKDGTVNPNKLTKHGFRKDFLVSYGIEPEELLTGEVIDQEPEESDGSESLS